MEQSDPELLKVDDAATDKEELLRDNFWNQRAILKALQDEVPHLRNDPTIDKRLENLWQTLALHEGANSDQRGPVFRSMFNVLLGWADDIRTDLWSLGWDGRHEIFNFTWPLRRWVATCGHGRQLTVTETGHIGLAPVNARKGDIVCSLRGCRAPLVLRPEGTHYLVVGEAYVHGYMALEAFQEVQDGTRQETTFVIR